MVAAKLLAARLAFVNVVVAKWAVTRVAGLRVVPAIFTFHARRCAVPYKGKNWHVSDAPEAGAFGVALLAHRFTALRAGSVVYAVLARVIRVAVARTTGAFRTVTTGFLSADAA